MMDILKYEEIDLAETIKRSEQDVNNVLDTVSDILNNVKDNGDDAVKSYTEKFDGVLVDELKVSEDEIKEAYDTLDDFLLTALKQAAQNIEKFHKKQIPQEWEIEVNPGIVAGQIVRPINSAGCYIPGGRAAYPSSILMTVIPAKIAGVEKVVCVTPPQKDGKILDAILVAADIAGADEIYKVGGAQAIGAHNADRRIDVIATLIHMGGTLEDLSEVELCYAPVVSTAKDAVHMAALVGLNVLNGVFRQVKVTEVRGLVENNAYIIDVRERKEYEMGHIIGSHNIPLSELRNRIDEIPKDQPVYLHCRSSQRSYNALRALQNLGFDNVYNISGSFLGLSLFEYAQVEIYGKKPILTAYNFN